MEAGSYECSSEVLLPCTAFVNSLWLSQTSCVTIACVLSIRRFAHLLLKKDISTPEVKKDLLRRVKNAISSTAERFSGYMQNVRDFLIYFLLLFLFALLKNMNTRIF